MHFLALSDFEDDKLAYVYDSNKVHASLTATHIKSEVKYIFSFVKEKLDPVLKQRRRVIPLKEKDLIQAYDIWQWNRKLKKYTSWKKNSVKNSI